MRTIMIELEHPNRESKLYKIDYEIDNHSSESLDDYPTRECVKLLAIYEVESPALPFLEVEITDKKMLNKIIDECLTAFDDDQWEYGDDE